MRLNSIVTGVLVVYVYAFGICYEFTISTNHWFCYSVQENICIIIINEFQRKS